VTTGEQLLEDFRRRRRAGDPRITPEGREILLRITKGDLAGDFAEAWRPSATLTRCCPDVPSRVAISTDRRGRP